jgi:hypothetical protein
LLRITGQHGMRISNSDHLVGKFNQHLRDCVFLFADEAFFAGDKKHVGVLKSLVTEETLTVEGKGSNIVQAPNYLHVVMASNETWVIPAELNDRRFFVLACGDEHRGDRAYWDALYNELENGGYDAMLYELLNMDISNFDVRSVPQTKGLQEQKQQTLELDYRWWQDILYRGYVWESECGLANIFCRWRDTVSTELLFKSYEKFTRQHRHRHPLHRNTFGKFLQEQLGAKPTKAQTTIGEQTKAGGFAEAIYGRVPAYHLGTLVISRAYFCKRTGLVIEWPDSDGIQIAANDLN